MTRANSEEILHKAVVEYLTLTLPKNAIFWHTPNGGSRNIIEAVKLKRMGTLAGVEDISILMRGTYVAIELKSAKGRQSAEQRARQIAVEKAGGFYFLCRSIEDVQRAITSVNFPETWLTWRCSETRIQIAPAKAATPDLIAQLGGAA